MNRILVIRGGAIGDFILTLPGLKALRDAQPYAQIEILGYKHIAALGENRFYAQAVRSIEYGPLASFFAKNSQLPPELATYFASFDLVISYLYDPDGIFESNLCRCGVDRLIRGPAKINKREHAARQLARPLEELGFRVHDLAARIFPLPKLAALFETAIFVGHDSGISQLAAAAGANCILLFGPTNPEIWAPRNEKVQVIQALTGDMPSLRFETVRDALINRLKACLPGK